MRLVGLFLAAKACAHGRQRFTEAVAYGDCPARLGHAAHRRTRYALRAALRQLR